MTREELEEKVKDLEKQVKELTGKSTDLGKFSESSEAQREYLELQARIAGAQGRNIDQLKLARQALSIYNEELAKGIVTEDEFTQKVENLSERLGLGAKSIDELKEAVEELSDEFIKGADAADDIGGSIARKFGMASDHSKTLVGRLQGLNEVLKDPDARKGFQARIQEIFTFTNMAGALLGAITEITVAFAFGVDKSVSSFVAATGASREFTSSIRNVGGEMMQFGINAEDAGKALTSLYSKFPGFINLTKQNQEELMKNVASLEKLGVASDVSARLFGNLTKTFKVTSSEAAMMVKELAFGAKAIGKPINAMISEFTEANRYLASYGKNSVKVFKDIASSAQAAGVEISDVLALSKKFDTFSSAAETAAKFSAVFGANLSALELVTMDVQDRMPYLVEQFKATGKEFSELDRYSQLSAASILGFGDDIEKAGKVLSMSTTEFTKYNEEQQKAAEQQKEYDQILKDAMPALMKIKTAFIQLATALAPLTEGFNEFAQFILDTSTSFKELFGSALIPFLVLSGLAVAAIIAIGVKGGMAMVPIGSLATAMTTLATALGAINVTGVPAGATITIIGNSSSGAAAKMAPLILSLAALAAGIGIAAAGMGFLIQSIGEAPGAVGDALVVLLGLSVAMIVLGGAAALAAKPLAVAALGIIAIGAGMGIALAGASLFIGSIGTIIDKLHLFKDLGIGTVATIFGIATAVYTLAGALALLTLGMPAMNFLTKMLVSVANVADKVAMITGNLAALSKGSVTAAFTAISEAMEEIESKIAGNIELTSTIENLALITTGQSSRTISGPGGAADTAGAIKDAFTNLGELFKPTVKVELELNNDKLAEFIKTVSVK